MRFWVLRYVYNYLFCRSLPHQPIFNRTDIGCDLKKLGDHENLQDQQSQSDQDENDSYCFHDIDCIR